MITRGYTREQFVRYLIAGATNTALTYGLLLVAMQWIAYLAAYTIVYLLGIAIGYWLQSRFVFRVPIDWRTTVRFPLVYIVQYVVGAVLLWLLVDVARIPATWAALLIVLGTVPLGFFLSRRIMAVRESSGA